MMMRWLIRRDRVTADMVRKHSEIFGTTLAKSKQMLLRETPKVLQYCTDGVNWIDVPTVVTPHEKENQSR